MLSWFVASLLATVALAGLSVWSGRTGRRRWHAASAVVFLCCLSLTILLAVRLGRDFSFDPLRLAVHRPLALAATLAFAGPVVTGLARWRRETPGRRRAHRAAVVLALALMLAAALTGVWMMASGTPRSGPAAVADDDRRTPEREP